MAPQDRARRTRDAFEARRADAQVAQVASYVATDSRAENIEICRERHKVRPRGKESLGVAQRIFFGPND